MVGRKPIRLVDLTRVTEIKLSECLLSQHDGIRHEASIGALEQAWKDASSKEMTEGYVPVCIANVKIQDLDGRVYENQPVILLDGFNDEAVIWNKPTNRRLAYDLYRIEVVKPAHEG